MQTLRDGSLVAIRPLEPDDRSALAAGFDRLSAESRYRRFFTPMNALSKRELDYLTNVDHHDHEALLAVEETTGDAVGVARFVRTGPEVAEPAIVVADDWQGRGVGSRLLDALADRARDEGIRRFEAPVLAGNDAAIRALERLGTTSRRNLGREVELLIELPVERDRTGRWTALLRQFAEGAVEPARTVLDVVRPRPRTPPDAPRRNVIVVGTDGSQHARGAVEAAADLAEALGAAVEVVGAHPFLLPAQDELRATVHEAAQALRERGIHVHEHLRRGDPAYVIAELASERDARLIVVGAGERAKATRRLIGGVADFVAERAPCNVLIVRPTAW